MEHKKNNKLKQPTKYTHSLIEQSQDQNSVNQQQKNIKQLQTNLQKTKKIKKKNIRKQNQPSAIRLQKINQTFDKLEKQGENFFKNVQLTTSLYNFLNIDKRNKCQQCNKTAKYYCMNCFKNCCGIQFPKVKLPIDIQILHHQSQKTHRSSVIPMKMLSQQIKIHKFSGNKVQKVNQKFNPQLQFNKQQTYILYPHKDSKTLSKQQIQKMKRLMILDCTWFQTDQMIDSLNQLGFKNYIRLDGYKSVYWRYNHHNDKALSSAESLMYFMRQYAKINQEQICKYDDIMFLYMLNLKMILRQQQKRQKQDNTNKQQQKKDFQNKNKKIIQQDYKQ